MHGKAPRFFFSKEEKSQIEKAIQKAEQNTSGEIRLHLLRSFPQASDPIEEGKKIFESLGMTATQERNGILFLLELTHQHFVILGDKGIHEKVEANFWDEIRDLVISNFKEKKFAEGLSQGIELCGEKLKVYFPRQEDDVNELSDEISFGE